MHRRPGLGRPADDRADHLPEAGRARPVGDHELVHRLERIQRDITAGRLIGCDVDPGARQRSGDGSSVRGGGDDRGHTARANGLKQVLAHLPGKFVAVGVEQHGMPARTPAEVLRSGSHGSSIMRITSS